MTLTAWIAVNIGAKVVFNEGGGCIPGLQVNCLEKDANVVLSKVIPCASLSNKTELERVINHKEETGGVDLLFLDIQMPGLDALDVVEKAIDMSRYIELKRSNNLARDFIMIRADHRMHKVLVNDIIDIEGLSEYVKIHTKQKTFITLMALGVLANTLDPNNFVRVHKSHIIHMPSVSSITANSATLVTGRIVPVGRTYKQAFQAASKRFGFFGS